MRSQDQIAERMEKYARASGHPRLVELLSRHASDQKDKFTLSDDEDQVCVYWPKRIFGASHELLDPRWEAGEDILAASRELGCVTNRR